MQFVDGTGTFEIDFSKEGISGLLKALEQDQFEIYYQPKIMVNTREVSGAEALIRWHHPELGLLPASRFFTALQDIRFARRVGEWAIENVKRDVQTWRKQGLCTVPVSINFHPQHITVPGFAQMLLRVSEGMIDVEILESAISRYSKIIPVLEVLRSEGVRIALDDFGIGYSSLGRLAEIPIDILKIDKSFVEKLIRSRSESIQIKAKRILSTIVSLAHICHFVTVAEGVETKAEFDAIAEIGCDESQGYFHSPAVDRSKFTQFLAPVISPTKDQSGFHTIRMPRH